jgi:hypothetical protein
MRRVTAARLEDGAVPRYKFHYPTLLELDSCRLAVVYTVGRKEHASAGGVKLAVIDLSKWAAKFGSVAPSEEDPPWVRAFDGNVFADIKLARIAWDFQFLATKFARDVPLNHLIYIKSCTGLSLTCARCALIGC